MKITDTQRKKRSDDPTACDHDRGEGPRGEGLPDFEYFIARRAGPQRERPTGPRFGSEPA